MSVGGPDRNPNSWDLRRVEHRPTRPPSDLQPHTIAKAVIIGLTMWWVIIWIVTKAI